MSFHVLAGGGVVQVRPVAPGDQGALRAAFHELSPESRYQRFLAHIAELSDELWRYLCEVDGQDHVALVAFNADGERLVGVARFIRLAVDRRTAEMAVTIADDWQRRGLGSLLLGMLIDAARRRGVVTFVAYALPTNVAVRRLMGRYGTLGVRVLDKDEVLWLPLRRGQERAA